MADNLKFWAAFLVLAGCIVFLGWREPIRYRFMSRAEIDVELFGTPVPQVVNKDPGWMWDPNRRTSLDQAPYQRKTFRDSTPRRY